jgi:hypothetical protein
VRLDVLQVLVGSIRATYHRHVDVEQSQAGAFLHLEPALGLSDDALVDGLLQRPQRVARSGLGNIIRGLEIVLIRDCPATANVFPA